MGVDGALFPSPYIYDAVDSVGRKISININFDETTRLIIDGTVHKDDGCSYNTIFVGLGTDGTVRGSSRKFDVPVGDNNIPKRIFNQLQLDTIEDLVENYQITAG